MLHDMRHTIYLCLMALTVLLCPACTGTLPVSTVPNDGQTATVCLHIPQLEAATRAAGTDLENAIYTLRVVILSTGAQSINRCFTSDELKPTLSIDNVPVGLVQIYVIANENSIGRDYKNLADLQADVEQTTKKLLITDPDRTCFPKRGSVFEEESRGDSPLGLPMGWMKKSQVINEGTNIIQVNLERQVAKLNIEMNNTLTSEIVISKISFGPFFSNAFYFFREETLDVPGTASYEETIYDGLEIPISGSSSDILVCYIYPSFAWKNETTPTPYTISFETKAGGKYDSRPFINQFGVLNSITRNTQVNIHATLSRTANVDINFEVVPWNAEDVNVPSFN